MTVLNSIFTVKGLHKKIHILPNTIYPHIVRVMMYTLNFEHILVEIHLKHYCMELDIEIVLSAKNISWNTFLIFQSST